MCMCVCAVWQHPSSGPFPPPNLASPFLLLNRTGEGCLPARSTVPPSFLLHPSLLLSLLGCHGGEGGEATVQSEIGEGRRRRREDLVREGEKSQKAKLGHKGRGEVGGKGPSLMRSFGACFLTLLLLLFLSSPSLFTGA